MKPKIPYILSIILFCLIAESCRSHKESAVAESSFVEINSTAQVNENLTGVSRSDFNSSISFDSIMIFIQRNWVIPALGDSSVFIRDNGHVYEVNFANITSPIPNTSSFIPLSEAIGIKAFNGKATASSASRDSISKLLDSSATQQLHSESQKDQTDSSDVVRVFEPPDKTTVFLWIIVIASIIVVFLIIYIHFKK